MTIFIRFRRSFSVHHQVLTIALLPALMVTAMVAIVVYRGTVIQGTQALNRQGQLLADQLASKLEYVLTAGAVEQLDDTLAATLEPAGQVLGIDIARVIVFDKQDNVIYRTTFSPQSGIPAATASLETWAVPVEDSRVFTTPIHLNPIGLELYPDRTPEKRYLGKVTIEMVTTSVKAELGRLFLWNLALVVGIFCLALILAHWTGSRFSRSIQHVAAAISRIKGGDLSMRIPPTGTHEIGTLQEGVNLLAETLATSREKLDRELNRVRSEYQQVLQDLQIQTEEAHQASQAKSIFLAKISHEMRTPLYSIQGLAERRLKAAVQPDEQSDVQGIHNAAQKLHHIISDILEYTQLERGKHPSLFVPLDLWEAIETELETIGPLAARQSLYLDPVVAPTVPPVVMGDAKAFRAIVANLLSNAVKFTEQGGVLIQLDVDSIQDGIVWVRLEVRDTGLGIPEDHLSTIFAPFEQVDGSLNRRYGGSGLGLSIVKAHCDSLGGDIQVDSRVNQGTTLTVRLPFRTAAGPVGALPQETGNLPPGFRVLVVDDRPSFCASVRCCLASFGVDVDEQTVSLQSLSLATPPSQPYDVLIMRDLSRFRSQELVALSAWACHRVSLETVHEPSRVPTLRDNGVATVQWSGIRRRALCNALMTLVTAHESVPLTVDSVTHDISPVAGLHTVLVAEDFEINRAIMAHQLQSHGFQVIEAKDGEEAITYTLQGGMDVILMDIQMPGKDGLTAIRELRERPVSARIPILGFTASADKPTHRKIIAAGADGVLIKPISEEELIAAVHRVLQKDFRKSTATVLEQTP